jgi:O-antigen/teichoic acid export membrane protein
MALLLIFMIPGIRFFFVFFPNFLGNNFDLVINFIPYTFISAVFSILGNFSATVLISENKNNDVFISTLIGALVNISTTTLLIYFGLGLFSAYIGLIAGFLTTYIIRNLRLKHFFQTNVPFKFIFILVIFSIVLINLINLL